MKRGSPLIWIMTLSVVLRLASALYQGNEVVPTPGAHDQISYDALARRVVEGHGFSFEEGWWPATQAGEPTAHWSYLQVLYLTFIYTAFGFQPIVARVIQAMIAGLIQPWLTWRISKRLFGEKAALAAALISALYGYFVYYAGALMSETFHILGLLWVCDLLTGSLAGRTDSGHGGRQTRTWVGLGCALVIATTTRQVTFLLIPVLVAWSFWERWRGSSSRGLRGSGLSGLARGWAIALLVLLLAVLPFTLRNYRAFGSFVLLNTNAGFAFYWANHPSQGTSFRSILEEGPRAYLELIPKDLRALGEAELNSRLLNDGLGFVRDDPVRFLWLSVSRLKDYFKFWPSRESSPISNLVRVGSFGLCLPLILLGIWTAISGFGLRDSPTGRSILLLLLVCLTYSSIHLASWSLIRYRIPVDAVLLLFSGLGLFRLLV